MPLIVEVLTEEQSIGLDAIDKVRRAEQLLSKAAPIQARWVQRFLRTIYVANLRRVPIRRVRRRGGVLGAQLIRSSTPGSLALVLLYLAVISRLQRFQRRFGSADRRAQYWQRVRRELLVGARRLDQWEDQAGYLPGVSVGRWEPWVDEWLGRAGLVRAPLANGLRDLSVISATWAFRAGSPAQSSPILNGARVPSNVPRQLPRLHALRFYGWIAHANADGTGRGGRREGLRRGLGRNSGCSPVIRRRMARDHSRLHLRRHAALRRDSRIGPARSRKDPP